MLSSIKDKLLNVKTLFNPNEQIVNLNQTKNLSAGSEILAHFEDDFAILHKTNEDNAKLAEKTANHIEQISNQIQRDKNNLELISHIINNSNLTTNIVNCKSQIDGIYGSFKELETRLMDLERIIEEVEYETLKKRHRFHLTQFKLKRNESLKKLELNLKDKYEENVKTLEINKRKILEERQQVFQEAFKDDLESFKSLGTIPKLDTIKNQPSALLEEIQIDYDEDELNNFLSESST